MVLTDDVKLPSPAEINHKEIPLTCNYLLASAMWLGKYCDFESKEYMLCRSEEKDPRKCLSYGHEITDCGFKFLRKVKNSCGPELEWYTKCLDYSGKEPDYRKCRPEQAIFDQCMWKNNFERAPFGYFQMIRVHESSRPKPLKNIPVFEDATKPFDFNQDVPDRTPHGAGGIPHSAGMYTM